MAKIVIGKQKDESESLTIINTSDNNSSTEIIFKTIEGKSIRKIYIDDASDKKNLLLELSKLSTLIQENSAVHNSIIKAKESVQNNDVNSMLKWLKKAGEVAFEVSVEHGLLLIGGILGSLR